jgi:uncharacterized repeat protein (TIGR01451 family)
LPVNKSRYDAHARATKALAVGLIALPAAMAAGPTGHHAAPHATVAPRLATPELTIGISDGRVAARPGETLRYRVSLRNTGTETAARLEVTQTVSPGLAITGASDNGVVKAAKITWTTAVPAGVTRTFLVTARVTRPPAQTLRLAAVACVTLPGSKLPTVCAAHLDQLPTAKAGPALHRSGMGMAPYAVAAFALFFGCLAVSFFGYRARLRRRLRSRAAARNKAAVPEMSGPAAPNANHSELPLRPAAAGRKKGNRHATGSAAAYRARNSMSSGDMFQGHGGG